MRDELLGEMSLLPFNTDGISGFKAPSTSYSYDRVLEHIEEDFSEETPSIFGLHPNAEIGYRTQQCSDLLRTMLTLSSGKDGSGLDQHNAQQVTEAIIQDILDNIRGTNIDIDTVLSNLQEVGPFQNFLIQECQRMNLLVDELVRSLSELDQGFRGDLMMSDAMERLAEALFLDRVPLTWESLAFPSLRNLSGWLADLHKRLQQLSEWIGYPAEMPKVVWISGLFNPQCFLTAVMQITSHAQGLELDKLTLVTELTKDTQAEDVTVAARDGTNIIGLFLEGAAWNTKHGFIDQSRPKQMFSSLPVINIKPAVVDKFRKNMFICPVYKTLQRGPTYVFSLQLRSNLEVGKWILAGVAAIMDIS
jgi:dynein heavy chain